MDERYDIIRMVRDKRFRYIRNYEPLKTYYQYMNTPEKGATMAELRQLHEAGQLPPAAENLFVATKPVEELYDCNADPHEIHNLAQDPRFASDLKRMRNVHLQWVQDTKDLGLIPEPIIAERRAISGSEYSILRQAGGDEYNSKLGRIAAAASEGPDVLPELLDALSDPDSAIRYWGATGIGNIGMAAALTSAKSVVPLLDDPCSTVRTAAARAICRMDRPQVALRILVNELLHADQWERLHAANVLDEINEQARPVLEEMKQGLQYQQGFTAKGKYRVRVINRALNELQGTSNTVR